MALSVDKQGTLPSRENLPDVEKSVIGINYYTNNESPDPHNRDNLNDGSANSTTRSTTIHLKKEMVKWSREEYNLVMIVFYEALHKPQKISLARLMTFDEKRLGKQLESTLTKIN